MEKDDKKQEVRAQRRAAILRAAEVAFIEVGFDRCTVTDILRGTTMRSSTFYNYFADKDDVLVAVIESSSNPLGEALAKALKGNLSLSEQVERMCHVYFDFVANSPVLCALLRQDCGRLRMLIGEVLVDAALGRIDAELRSANKAGLMPAVDGDYLKAMAVGVTFELGLRMLARTPCRPREAARFAALVIVGGLERLAEGEAAAAGRPQLAEAPMLAALA